MEIVKSIIDSAIKYMVSHQLVIAYVLCYIISYASGFISATFRFKDRLGQLLFSWEIQCYSIVSGFFSLFIFKVVRSVNLSIADITLNENPFVTSVIVGVGGFQLFLSLFKSNSALDSSIKGNFNNFFDGIQNFLFRRYAVRRNERIRKEVTLFMTGFPIEKLYELLKSSEIIIKDIDEDDWNALYEKYKEVASFGISDDGKAFIVGVALSQVIGLEIIKNIASKLKKDNDFDKSKSSAKQKLKDLDQLIDED